jgi:hypothetical protein
VPGKAGQKGVPGLPGSDAGELPTRETANISIFSQQPIVPAQSALPCSSTDLEKQSFMDFAFSQFCAKINGKEGICFVWTVFVLIGWLMR